MTIQKVNVIHFGKLRDFEITFNPGFNIVYGKNESGKSTLQAFIKALFYGMNSQRKDLKENDRLRFIPWGKDKAHGELYYRDQYHNEYILKRSFGRKRKEDGATVINSITGETPGHIQLDKPGEDLLGLGEDAFEKTVWIKQLGCSVLRSKDDEIMNRLTNLQESGDEQVSFRRAMEGLMEARKVLVNQRKTGRLDQLKQQRDQLLQELRHSNVLHDKMLEDQAILNGLIGEREGLQNQIHWLQEEKAFRKDHEEFHQCQMEIKKIEVLKNSLSNRIQELNFLLEDFKGYEELPEDIEYQLFAAENEKKNSEEKMSLYDQYKTEYEDLEKYYQYILSLEIDRLKGKNKLQTCIFVLAVGIMASGIVGGLIQNPYLFSLFAVGFIMGFVSGMARRQNSKQLQFLKDQITPMDNRVSLETNITTEKLAHIYRELGLNNLHGFRVGLKKHLFPREVLEVLKIKLKEKERSMEQMNIHRIEAKLSDTMDFIRSIFEIGNCKSMEEFTQKIKYFRGLMDEKKSNLKELTQVGEKLVDESQKLKELGDKVKNPNREGLPLTEGEMDRQVIEAHQQLIEIEKKIKDVEHDLGSLFYGFRQPVMIEEEIVLTSDRATYYEGVMESLDLAITVLQEAFGEMQRSFGPRLNRITGDILGRITEGRYEDLKVSEDYQIKLVDSFENGIKEMDYFSNGTWDQIYFSLRLGLVELIFHDKKNIPLLLDDTFIQFDNHRLKRVLEYLYECSQDRQIILFTCHKRELEMLKEHEGINVIKLQ